MLNIDLYSIAINMEPSIPTDADRLKGFVAGLQVTQAAFARSALIPGGPSMLSQHLSGHRPISLEAGIAYARGFGAPIDAISPSLARKVREAVALLDPAHAAMYSAASLQPETLHSKALRELTELVPRLTADQTKHLIDCVALMVDGGKAAWIEPAWRPELLRRAPSPSLDPDTQTAAGGDPS